MLEPGDVHRGNLDVHGSVARLHMTRVMCETWRTIEARDAIAKSIERYRLTARCSPRRPLEVWHAVRVLGLTHDEVIQTMGCKRHRVTQWVRDVDYSFWETLRPQAVARRADIDGAINRALYGPYV